MQNWGGILVEKVYNNEIIIHTRCRLVEDNHATGKTVCGYISHVDHDMSDARPLTKAIVNRLRSLKGILRVSVCPYKVIVHMSPAFSVDELKPEIIKTFAMYIPAEDFISR